MFATCSCPLCPAWWRGCCWGWRRSSRCFPPSSFRYTQPALWGSDCPWCPHRPGNSTPAETCLKYQYFCLLSNTQNTGVFSERRPTVIARDFYSNIKLINLPRRRPEMQIFVFFSLYENLPTITGESFVEITVLCVCGLWSIKMIRKLSLFQFVCHFLFLFCYVRPRVTIVRRQTDMNLVTSRDCNIMLCYSRHHK